METKSVPIPTEIIDLPLGGKITIYRGFLDKTQAGQYYQELAELKTWIQTERKMFGKVIKIPRLQCWMGDVNVRPQVYAITQRQDWTRSIDQLRQQFSQITGCDIDYVLLNQYVDGTHSIAWHCDEEASRDHDVIVSVSLGSSRRFCVKPDPKKYKGSKNSKDDKWTKYEWSLRNGDVVIMDGIMQRNYVHCVPKTKTKVGPRINMTFRIS